MILPPVDSEANAAKISSAAGPDVFSIDPLLRITQSLGVFIVRVTLLQRIVKVQQK